MCRLTSTDPQGAVCLERTDVDGKTPLFHAAQMGQTRVLKELLLQGADPLAESKLINAPLLQLRGDPLALKISELNSIVGQTRAHDPGWLVAVPSAAVAGPGRCMFEVEVSWDGEAHTTVEEERRECLARYVALKEAAAGKHNEPPDDAKHQNEEQKSEEQKREEQRARLQADVDGTHRRLVVGWTTSQARDLHLGPHLGEAHGVKFEPFNKTLPDVNDLVLLPSGQRATFTNKHGARARILPVNDSNPKLKQDIRLASRLRKVVVVEAPEDARAVGWTVDLLNSSRTPPAPTSCLDQGTELELHEVDVTDKRPPALRKVVVGVALDTDANQLLLGVDGKWWCSGPTTQALSGLFPAVSVEDLGQDVRIALNCGDRPFKYPLKRDPGSGSGRPADAQVLAGDDEQPSSDGRAPPTDDEWPGVTFLCKGEPPVMVAARKKHVEVVEALLAVPKVLASARGLRDKAMGATLLHYLASWGPAADERCQHMVEALLEGDNELQEVRDDQDGRTALHWAARHNTVKAAKALLMYDPDGVDRVDAHGLTPTVLAVKHDSAEVLGQLPLPQPRIDDEVSSPSISGSVDGGVQRLGSTRSLNAAGSISGSASNDAAATALLWLQRTNNPWARDPWAAQERRTNHAAEQPEDEASQQQRRSQLKAGKHLVALVFGMFESYRTKSTKQRDFHAFCVSKVKLDDDTHTDIERLQFQGEIGMPWTNICTGLSVCAATLLRLSLQDVDQPGEINELLEACPNLELLELKGCSHVCGDVNELAGSCAKLKSLEISDMAKVEGELASIAKHGTVLQKLILSFTGIRGDLKDLASLSATLDTLELSGTQVKGDILDLLPCAKLEIINLQYCKDVQVQGAQDFKNSLCKQRNVLPSTIHLKVE